MSKLLEEIDREFEDLFGERCPECNSLKLKEYSSQLICMNCGAWVKKENCLSKYHRELGRFG